MATTKSPAKKAKSKTTGKTASKKTAPKKAESNEEFVSAKKVDELLKGDIFKQGDRTRGTMVYQVLGAPIPKEENENEMIMETKIVSSTKNPKLSGAKEKLHFQKRLSQWKTVEMVKK